MLAWKEYRGGGVLIWQAKKQTPGMQMEISAESTEPGSELWQLHAEYAGEN
jgi:hypothetical protein